MSRSTRACRATARTCSAWLPTASLIDGAAKQGAAGSCCRSSPRRLIGPIFFRDHPAPRATKASARAISAPLFESIELDQIRRGRTEKHKAKEETMAKNWIPLRQVEGNCLAPGPWSACPRAPTSARSSKEGLLRGLRRSSITSTSRTDWVEFERRQSGPPRLRPQQACPPGKPSPWKSELVMANPHLQMRIWSSNKPDDPSSPANSDGDQLPVRARGRGGRLFCDYGHLDYRDGRLPRDPRRGTMWRLSAHEAYDVANGRGDQRPFHPAGKEGAWSGRPRDLRPGRSSTRPGSTTPFRAQAGRAHLGRYR